MNPELEKLSTHRLSRAQDAFAEGDYLLAKKAFMGAVNRFYYSAPAQSTDDHREWERAGRNLAVHDEVSLRRFGGIYLLKLTAM